MSDQKLSDKQRLELHASWDPDRYAPFSDGQLRVTELRVQLSIDARLAEIAYYLQNQDERTRPNAGYG